MNSKEKESEKVRKKTDKLQKDIERFVEPSYRARRDYRKASTELQDLIREARIANAITIFLISIGTCAGIWIMFRLLIWVEII